MFSTKEYNLNRSSSPASRGGSLSAVAVEQFTLKTFEVVIPCVAGRFFELTYGTHPSGIFK